MLVLRQSICRSSIHPSIHPSIYLSTYLSIYLPIYLPIYLSIYISTYLSSFFSSPISCFRWRLRHSVKSFAWKHMQRKGSCQIGRIVPKTQLQMGDNKFLRRAINQWVCTIIQVSRWWRFQFSLHLSLGWGRWSNSVASYFPKLGFLSTN